MGPGSIPGWVNFVCLCGFRARQHLRSLAFVYVYLRFKGASTAQVIGARMNDCDDNDGQMIFGDPGA